MDHVEKYRLPKHVREREDERIKNGERDDDNDDDESDGSGRKKKGVSVAEAGHAYKGQELASSYDIHAGQDLFAAPPKMGSDDQRDLTDEEKNSNNGGEVSTIQHKDMDKAERRRRKEERAQKRREKEEHRRKKEERKRRKHDNQHDRGRKEEKRRHSRSDSN